MNQHEEKSRDLKLKKIFSQDGTRLMDSLRRVISKIIEGEINNEIVNQTFRYIHSIKSEAAFLRYTEIKENASALEDLLGIIRKSPDLIDSEQIELLSKNFGSLEKNFFSVTEQINKELDILSVGMEPKDNSENDEELQFSHVEEIMIDEAIQRGEYLFHIYCEIDKSEPMQFARLYLIINNLEMTVNVLKTVPDINTLKEGNSNNIQIYCTSEMPPDEIEDIIDVDQIQSVRIEKIDWIANPPNEDPLLAVSPDLKQNRAPLVQQRDNRESIYLYMIKKQVEAILLDNSEFDDSINVVFKKSRLLSIREMLNSLELSDDLYPSVSFSDIYTGISELVIDLSESLGKKIELVCTETDYRIAKKNADMLSTAIKHLVRNAIDHGIEAVSTRAANGKPEAGTIELEVSKSKTELIISVTDDGIGINSDVTEDNLLDTITEPGYSTKGEATDISGRGVGLDIVKNLVENRLGGSLLLKNSQGEGCSFKISIPDRPVFDFYLVQTEGIESAVPINPYLKIERFDERLITLSDDGSVYYRINDKNVPLYSIHGKLKHDEPVSSFKQILLYRSLRESFGLGLEKYIGETESFLINDEDGHLIFKDGGKEKIPVLILSSILKSE
jgi:two-component system, chemotaxis family, sensor kinase CheA